MTWHWSMNWHRNDLALMRAGADYWKLFAPLSIEAMNYIEAERGRMTLPSRSRFEFSTKRLKSRSRKWRIRGSFR